MQEKYRDVFISYREHDNKWVVDDSEKAVTVEASSLKEAKEKVDAVLKKQFTRFKAWKSGSYYHSGFAAYMQVEITSIVEGYRRTEAWITYPKRGNERPQREKVPLHYLYKIDDDNNKIVEQLNAVTKEIDELHKKRSELVEKLVPIEEPSDT